MAKLLKLRRGSTSQHNSFTGAEGEVTIDTDKDTAVVHDGTTAGGRPLAREDMSNVSSASIAGRLSADSISTDKINAGALPTDVTVASQNIVNGTIVTGDIASDTIVNSNINSGAAIAGTKINPDFGSQNITTTGTLTASGNASVGETLSITGNDPNITFVDSNNNPDFKIFANAGSFSIYDDTNSATRLKVNTDGHIDINANADFSSGIDVTGNITVTGTVDGVDIAALNTAVSGLSSGSSALTNGVTATTQGSSDNSTKVATTAYVTTALSNLVDSSPSALNTLNELAAAINDDASFSTTMTNNLATKMPLAGGEFTGNITVENITPDADSSRNLGTNSVRFANGYFDTLYGDGSNLTGIVSFVQGMIILWSGAANNLPSGWVLCDGNNSTPDLRGRFVVGHHPSNGSYDVNDTGGAETVTLTTAQLPAHSHTGNSHTHSANFGNHTHSFSGSGSSSHSPTIPGANDRCCGYLQGTAGTRYNGNQFSTNSATVSLTISGNTGNASVSGNTDAATANTNNTGRGHSHENRPPYYALCYIMKS